MNGPPTNHDPRAPALGGRCAFTLIELALVMATLSVLAAIAVPRFAQGDARRRLEACEKRVIADIEYARGLARARSQSVAVTFYPDADSYTIDSDRDLLTRVASGYAVDLGQRPYRAELGAVDLGGDEQMIFDGYGEADSGGTVQIAAGGRTVTVTIDGS